MQKAFNGLSVNSSLCGPCSLGKSLWAQVKNRFLFLTRKFKKKKTSLHSSVITVRQSLILCWKQWCRLSLPYPVLLVSGCLAHGRWGTRNGCWRCTAEHPHSQRVVRKLRWTCIKESFSKSKMWAVLRDLYLKDGLVLVVTTNRNSVSENPYML